MLVATRQLILLRHAKSRWDEAGKTDFERDLAPRGLRACQRLGNWLRQRGYQPELALCSTATRAQKSWSLIRQVAQLDTKTVNSRELYLATPERIAEQINQQADAIKSLIVIGHNPGMHAYAAQLLGKQTPTDLVQNLPTGGLIILQLHQTNWRNIASADLIDYVIPRRLEAFE